MPENDTLRDETLRERDAAYMEYMRRQFSKLEASQKEISKEVTATRQPPSLTNGWRGKIIAALITLAIAGIVGAAGIVYGYGDRLITVETTQTVQSDQITEIKQDLKTRFKSIDDKQDSTNSKLDTLIGAFEESRRK
jgi:uncharacterized coiled-coil protein SlyX